MSDPRLYQIAVLASLLAYGMGWLGFDVTWPRVCLLLATALGTQAIGDCLTARAATGRPDSAGPTNGQPSRLLRNAARDFDVPTSKVEVDKRLLSRGGLPAVNVKSALISGLSLCLLLRTSRPELAVLAAALTIAGKFLI